MLLIQEINYEHNINAVITIRDIRSFLFAFHCVLVEGWVAVVVTEGGVLIRCQGEGRAVLVNYLNELNNNDQYTRYKPIIHVFI